MFKYKSYQLMFIIVICLNSLSSNATDISTLNPLEKLTIKSERFPEGITLNVTLPQGYQEQTDKEYVVLFDLHPRSQPYLSGMHDWMGHNGEWPWLDTIIVTNSGNYNETLGKYHEAAVEGKNQILLDFFELDLLSELDKKYRTNGFRIFSGFTGNGSLGIYTLLNRPELFNAYIAASPNLSDNHLNIVSQAQEQLSKLNKPRYLFLSIGNSNYEKAQLESFSKLEKIISNHPNQHLTRNIKRFDDAYYMSQPVLATAHAIEDIFKDINEDLSPDSAISQQGAQAIIKHYQYLSKEKFGFEISAQSSLTALGLSLVQTDADKAIDVLLTSIKAYPDSTFAYSALAKAYFQLNLFENAIKYQTIAVAKSKSLIPWHQRKQQSYLEQYQRANKK